MKRKILILAITFLSFNIYAKSLTYAGCEYSTISRLKSLVNNVNISYSYNIRNFIAYFDVTINNITQDMYFVDTYNEQTYTYYNTNAGEITIRNYNNVKSGQYVFYSNANGCYGKKIGTKYYNFPNYNTYSDSKLCSDISNYSLCNRWANANYSYDELEILIKEYKDSLNKVEKQPTIEYKKTLLDKIAEYYAEYYYYYLIGIILVCGFVIFLKDRKNKFDL